MRIGYARVSTDHQRVDMQVDALKKAGCDQIFTDEGISGSIFEREGLEKLVSVLKNGDTLVVWRLDRVGRNLAGLVAFVGELGKRGVDLCSLTENIDTSSSGGRLVFHMMAALAEFERSLISERTRAGMQAARNKGKRIGRPQAMSAMEIEEARHAIFVRKQTIREVAQRYKVSYRTIMRIVAREL